MSQDNQGTPARNPFGIGNQPTDLTRLIDSAQASVQAINNLTKTLDGTLSTVFPIGAVVNSAGGASGKYLAFTAADGQTYKVALLNP